MIINDLYRIAAEHDHEIVSLPLRESPSFAIEDSTGCHIALSDHLSGANKKTKLAHELGHCEFGGFYNYHSPFSLRSKCEARADRWAFLHLMPLNEIKEAIDHGASNIWEISQYFDVTPDFAEAAIRFYLRTFEIGSQGGF